MQIQQLKNSAGPIKTNKMLEFGDSEARSAGVLAQALL
jgi:hypothetical protein